jgi:hypothetical protein
MVFVTRKCLIRDFYDFRYQLEKNICNSKNTHEVIILGVFNLDSGKVRRVQMRLEKSSFSNFLLGFELGIGHWDNHKLLGFPSNSVNTTQNESN